MKKAYRVVIILIIIILSLFIVALRNGNKFEELNAEIVALGEPAYERNNVYVRFVTLRDMEKLVDTTIKSYNDNIIKKQQEVIKQIEESKYKDELSQYIEDVNNINNDVSTYEEYHESMSTLAELDKNIKVINSSNSMDFVVADTKKYMEENFTPEELETITVGLIDLESGVEVYFNEDFLFYSASTIKVPINMYMYDLIASGEVSLDDTIIYTPEYYEGGTGIFQFDPYGTIYTIDEILTQSIVSSDNVATNMLIFNYFANPSDLTNDLEKYWGYCNLDYSTSRECSVTNHINSLEYLYNHSEEYSMLIQDMKDSIYKDMVPKYIDVEVANKVGMEGSILIDDAIVYTEQPYAISMAFVGIEDAEERMALLSQEIYNNWNKYMK